MISAFLFARKETLAKKRAKGTTDKKHVRVFYTFSPLETPFGLRKFRRVVYLLQREKGDRVSGG